MKEVNVIVRVLSTQPVQLQFQAGETSYGYSSIYTEWNEAVGLVKHIYLIVWQTERTHTKTCEVRMVQTCA